VCCVLQFFDAFLKVTGPAVNAIAHKEHLLRGALFDAIGPAGDIIATKQLCCVLKN